MTDLPPHRLEDILNGVADIALFLDRSRKILAANAAAWRAFGAGVLNQNLVQAIRQPEVLRLIGRCQQDGGQAQDVLSLDGALKGVFRVTVSAVGDAGLVLSFADLTDIHAAERMRSDFVANVSHELRSPLTTISGFIETLQGPAQNDAAARVRFLNVMKKEAERMDRLIGDLLSLSRVEGDSRVRPRAKVDVAELILRVKATLSHQAAARSVAINLRAGSHAALVEGDEDQLTQVFSNLVENAIKYGVEGGVVTVEITRLPKAAGIFGGALSIAVKDQGAGIAKSHIPRLTERFYRVDDGRSREKGGTGLGLAIVKHIVQRHRGRLLIDSVVGEGSTFTVILPEAEAPATAG